MCVTARYHVHRGHALGDPIVPGQLLLKQLVAAVDYLRYGGGRHGLTHTEIHTHITCHTHTHSHTYAYMHTCTYNT
jgi:3-hydroxymyristoyl/3-hydroxydecanoyl-(acyl carrier protein) dehydratase